RSAAFSASSRLFDLKSDATRLKMRNISATIMADVMRFSHQINTDEVFDTHRCHAPILVAITSLSPASQPPAADRPKNMGGSGRVIKRKLIATVRRESAVVAAAMATVPENSYIFPALKRSRHGLRNHQRHAAHWRRGRP